MKPSDVSIECETFDFVIQEVFSSRFHYVTGRSPDRWISSARRSTFTTNFSLSLSFEKIIPSMVIVRAPKINLSIDRVEMNLWEDFVFKQFEKFAMNKELPEIISLL